MSKKEFHKDQKIVGEIKKTKGRKERFNQDYEAHHSPHYPVIFDNILNHLLQNNPDKLKTATTPAQHRWIRAYAVLKDALNGGIPT
ncbi:MAG TPA: hypothetical protein VMW06_03895, partial [Desulfobacterales bacterium]|nr:hypothetical protein [Desulfobacterales bacterium]